MENNNNVKKGNNKIFNIVIGIIFIALGVIFFIRNIYQELSIEKLWPLFMLIPVVFLIGSLLQNAKKNSGTIVPIVILSILTAYFLWLNFAGWENVQYTWPVFTFAPGVGLLSLFLLTKERGLLIPSSILIIISAFFFGNIINSNILIGSILIAIGIIIFSTSIFKKKKYIEKP